MRPLLVCFLLLLAACQTDETISGQVDKDDIWVLTQQRGTTVAFRATITFPETGRITGQAPCNSYFAKQTAPLPWFEIGPIGATKRACEQLQSEQKFFEALRDTTMAEVQGDVLILSDESGPLLVFRRAR